MNGVVTSRTSDLRSLVETSKPGTAQVARKKRLVYETVLRESAHLDGGNFTVIDTTDLQRLFNEYDRHCFECYGYDIMIDNQLKPWLLEARLQKPKFPIDSIAAS